MQNLTYGSLDVTIGNDSAAIGDLAANDFAATAAALLEDRAEISVIMSTGNSQRDFYEALVARDDIDWSRITVMHVDEYLGVSPDRPESTTWRMRSGIVDRVHPRAFHAIDGEGAPEEEIARYSRLLEELPPSICILGVGENGHVAFNDPPADFDTRELVIQVSLSDASKRQIVGEGRFANPGDVVPDDALTLTVFALLRPDHVIVIVPDARKAVAIQATLEGPIAPSCPASILRSVDGARMYLDQDSSALLEARR